MEALIKQTQGLNVKDETGSATQIPQNNYAKLMYYLSCVRYCLGNTSRVPLDYTKYNNYRYLDADDKAAILLLCSLFSIDVLEDKCFFTVAQNHKALKGTMCRFYEVTETTRTLGVLATACEAILVDGKEVKHLKFET